MHFDGRIEIDNLLTTVTIAVSVVALLLSWRQDRSLRVRDRADRVRRAAAITLGKLDRWQELIAHMYLSADALFVRASRMMAKNFDWAAARDWLWLHLQEHRTKTVSQTLADDLQSGYVDLVMYQPPFRATFLEALATLRTIEERIYFEFIEACQDALQKASKTDQARYTAAGLGNTLRLVAYEAHQAFREQSSPTLDALTRSLVTLIHLSDRVLSRGNFKPEALQ